VGTESEEECKNSTKARRTGTVQKEKANDSEGKRVPK
jgi:hypothetical protein